MKEGWKRSSPFPNNTTEKSVIYDDKYMTCPRCDGEPENCILDTDICTNCDNTGVVLKSEYFT